MSESGSREKYLYFEHEEVDELLRISLIANSSALSVQAVQVHTKPQSHRSTSAR